MIALGWICCITLGGCSKPPAPKADIRLNKNDAGQVQAASLVGRNVSDDDLKQMTSHAELTELRLQECSKVTALGLAHLKGKLPKLQLLELVRVPIDDSAMESLASAANLTDVSLAHTNIAGAGLSQLANSPVKRLTLFSRTVTVEGMQAIGTLKQLEELELQCQDLKLNDLTSLSELKALKKLVAYRTPVGKGGLSVLKGLNSLEYLHVSSTDIDDASIEVLNQLSNLQTLIVDNGGISDAGIKRLSLPKLKQLSLDGCRGITDLGLGNFAGMPAIESLMLGSTGVKGVDLTPLSNLLHLKEVRLMGNQFRGTPESIEALKKKLPNCEVLIMRG